MSSERSDLTRRQALGLLGGAAAGTLAASALAGCSSDAPSAGGPPASTTTTRAASRSTVPPAQRKLVVVELAGGNDSLSTLVPMESGVYRDARPQLAIPPEELIDLGDGYGLNRQLAGLHEAGLALLAGVGTHRPNMSHFDMRARWWAGSPNATPGDGPGFLGKLCDQLGKGDVRGVAIGRDFSPALAAELPSTVGLVDPSRIRAADTGPAQGALLEALAAYGSSSAAARSPRGRTASATATMLHVNDLLAELPPAGTGYPGPTDTGGRMAADFAFAGQLLRADIGVQVIHLSTDAAAFDTHGDHRAANPEAWDSVLPGLVAFRAELEEAGLTDQVMIATTSEFGRRFPEHGTGLDHGAAGCALIMGPTKPGVVGEHPSLTKLDEAQNLIATVRFDRYLATMAAWLDVNPRAVLDTRAAPIDRLLEV